MSSSQNWLWTRLGKWQEPIDTKPAKDVAIGVAVSDASTGAITNNHLLKPLDPAPQRNSPSRHRILNSASGTTNNADCVKAVSHLQQSNGLSVWFVKPRSWKRDYFTFFSFFSWFEIPSNRIPKWSFQMSVQILNDPSKCQSKMTNVYCNIFFLASIFK